MFVDLFYKRLERLGWLVDGLDRKLVNINHEVTWTFIIYIVITFGC